MTRLARILQEQSETSLKEKLFNFFAKNPYPKDSDVHKFSENNGMDSDKVENIIYEILSDFITGKGFKHGEDDVSQYDPEEIKMGIEVEKEHHDHIPIRKSIALAHLAEIKDYYTRLKKMEKEAGVNESYR